MSMCPAPTYSFKLACWKLAASRRAKTGGVRRSLVPTATATGTSTASNVALSSKPSTSPTSFANTSRLGRPQHPQRRRHLAPAAPGARIRSARRGSRRRRREAAPRRAAQMPAPAPGHPADRRGEPVPALERAAPRPPLVAKSAERADSRRRTARGGAGQSAGRPCPPSNGRRARRARRSSAVEHLGHVVGHRRDGHALGSRARAPVAAQVDGDHAMVVGRGRAAGSSTPRRQGWLRAAARQAARRRFSIRCRLAPVAHDDLVWPHRRAGGAPGPPGRGPPALLGVLARDGVGEPGRAESAGRYIAGGALGRSAPSGRPGGRARACG